MPRDPAGGRRGHSTTCRRPSYAGLSPRSARRAAPRGCGGPTAGREDPWLPSRDVRWWILERPALAVAWGYGPSDTPGSLHFDLRNTTVLAVSESKTPGGSRGQNQSRPTALRDRGGRSAGGDDAAWGSTHSP